MPTPTPDPDVPTAGLLRSLFGGVLMGLANLVPGISGGTMLLAAGVYPQVIDGVAEVSTFRFRLRTFVMLSTVIAGALLAIVGLAGPVKQLVIDHRWIMYSLFIGLTLGGVPILWRMLRPLRVSSVLGAVAGIAAMIALVAAEHLGWTGSGAGEGRFMMLVVAGVAGGSAMILPGVSGGYLLLVLGQYVVILEAISGAKSAVRGDGPPLMDAVTVLAPVVVGVVLGVVVVSNVVRALLHRFEKATLGVLLGLLLGAVVGLWPFQRAVPPETFGGEPVVMRDGQAFLETSGTVVKPSRWPTETFGPGAAQVAGALGLVAAGLLVSIGIGCIGGAEASDRPTDDSGRPAGS